MSEARRTVPARRWLRIFLDTPMKPRIVLGLLLIGSLAGVWISHPAVPLLQRLVWWLALVTSGTLAGALYWRVVLFNTDGFGDVSLTETVRYRWRRLETVLVWSFVVSLPALLVLDDTVTGFAGSTAILTLSGVVVVGAWFTTRMSPANPSRHAARIVAFTAATAVLVTFAWIETAGATITWLVRLGHLGAVGLWFGGAVWHNGVILPTVVARPEAKPPLMQQAKRFRRHLFGVIPVVFGTGSYQTVQLTGDVSAAFFTTPVGYVVALKITVLAGLAGLVLVSVLRSS